METVNMAVLRFLSYINVRGRIILKCTTWKAQSIMVWIGFTWLRLRTGGVLFWIEQ
jgi:hypothetical protein